MEERQVNDYEQRGEGGRDEQTETLWNGVDYLSKQ